MRIDPQRAAHAVYSPSKRRTPITVSTETRSLKPSAHSARTLPAPLFQNCPHAFTLIETMLAVLLMALLASAVSLSFSKPLQAARAQDAVELIRSFDFTARRSAINSGRAVRLVFDLSANTLLQKDGSDLTGIRRQIPLPAGCIIDTLKIDEKSIPVAQAIVDISPNGWSRTYSLHLSTAANNQWLLFSGLTGQMTTVQNESQIPTYSDAPRHNTD